MNEPSSSVRRPLALALSELLDEDVNVQLSNTTVQNKKVNVTQSEEVNSSIFLAELSSLTSFSFFGCAKTGARAKNGRSGGGEV